MSREVILTGFYSHGWVLDDDLAGDLWAIGQGRILLLRAFSELRESIRYSELNMYLIFSFSKYCYTDVNTMILCQYWCHWHVL